MKITILFLLLLFFSQANTTLAQDKPAYVLYNKDGETTTYSAMLQKATQASVVLFGEIHNNPISHWLQLEITQDIFKSLKNKPQTLVMGAEMFESDNQLLLDEYLKGYVDERNFKTEAKLWRNYDTDYRPLVEFAKSQSLPFIATNIPRRYASIVNHEGFEGLHKLSPEALTFIAPLPIKYDATLPGYSKMLEMAHQMPGHQTAENFPKAQAIKDATMAHFINKNLSPNQIFIHFHGAFHSDYFDGIFWYLKQYDKTLDILYDKTLDILTISTVEQEDISSLEDEHIGKADFIICVPTTMTKTY